MYKERLNVLAVELLSSRYVRDEEVCSIRFVLAREKEP
jgi:hypothetical protein